MRSVSGIPLAIFLLCLLIAPGIGADAGSAEEYTVIDHLIPENGLRTLEFDTEGYRQLGISTDQTILAYGTFENRTVGFRLSFKPDWSGAKGAASEKKGFLSFESIGEKSENLAYAFNKLFGGAAGLPKFKSAVIPAVCLKGWPYDWRTGRIDFLMKGEGESKEGYFELLLSVYKDKQTIWIQEVKPEYRKNVAKAFVEAGEI